MKSGNNFMKSFISLEEEPIPTEEEIIDLLILNEVKNEVKNDGKIK